MINSCKLHMQTFSISIVKYSRYVCIQTIISQEYMLTLSLDTFISHHHKSSIRLSIFPELAHFIDNLQNEIQYRTIYQSGQSVTELVLWPPPLCLPLLWHHHISHWSVTILRREPIGSVGAGYTSQLLKYSVEHAIFCCRPLLQSHACSSVF